MTAPRVYVAHPYTGQEQYARDMAEDFCAYAWRRGWHPYSPIAHWHRIATRFGLPTDAATWSAINERELRQSDMLAVLRLTGWRDSVGLRLELDWSDRYGLPVRLFDRTHQAGWVEVADDCAWRNIFSGCPKRLSRSRPCAIRKTDQASPPR